jgi:signal transduction histidine kinase
MKTKYAYWACQLIGWGSYVALGLTFATQAVGWRASVVVGYVLFGGYSIALTDLLRREIRRRQWLDASPGLMLGRMALAVIVIGMVQTFLVFSVTLMLTGRLTQMGGTAALLSIWVSVTGADCVWVVFYVAATGPRRYREKEVRLQLAVREAELRALEAQLNPHFLFNSLNSIRALVVENPPLAQDMLTRLANILRYNLHRDLMHTIPLASELEVVTDYLALEGVRFEDRLRVEFAIDPEAAQVAIPPMLLQALVENALKHGIAPLPSGGDIVIRAALQADGMVVEVENTGQIAPPAQGATQVGLANTRERLRILYGDGARLELANRGDNRVAATVRMPRPG